MCIHRILLIVVVGLCCIRPTVGQELKVDVAAVKALVKKWNEAHTLNTIDNFGSVYSDRVDFYGSNQKRSKCISAKRAMLRKHQDFNQAITTDLLLSGYSGGAIRCDFNKAVTRENKTTEYPSYLIIARIGGTYLIVGEGNVTTDRDITSKSDLGKKVTIKDINNDVDTSGSAITDVLIAIGSLAVGIIGLVTGIRSWPKNVISKKPKPKIYADTHKRSTSAVMDDSDYYETGLAFEKYIVKQFAVNKGLFTLLEWRSDKFHDGVYASSSQYPDLVYEYSFKNYVHRFSIECKYRSRFYNNAIELMDITKYRIYEAYHLQEMPVYIVLGVGGKPNNPATTYLIPFAQVKPTMTFGELTGFEMKGSFFYDMHTDRLTWYAGRRFN